VIRLQLFTYGRATNIPIAIANIGYTDRRPPIVPGHSYTLMVDNTQNLIGFTLYLQKDNGNATNSDIIIPVNIQVPFVIAGLRGDQVQYMKAVAAAPITAFIALWETVDYEVQDALKPEDLSVLVEAIQELTSEINTFRKQSYIGRIEKHG
jgi:hypothetical protein